MNPLINILIRTSNRPELFKRCIQSVRSQTYKNVNVIVSYDTMSTYGYLVQHLGSIDLLHVHADKSFPVYWNLYCNQLKSIVFDGWFSFLDDDDLFDSTDVLEKIAVHLNDPSQAVICQFRRNGKPKPVDALMDQKQIVKGKIGMPCIFLHSSQKGIAFFGGYEDSDYTFIKEVSEKLPTIFIKQVVVCADRRSNGKTEV